MNELQAALDNRRREEQDLIEQRVTLAQIAEREGPNDLLVLRNRTDTMRSFLLVRNGRRAEASGIDEIDPILTVPARGHREYLLRQCVFERLGRATSQQPWLGQPAVRIDFGQNRALTSYWESYFIEVAPLYGAILKQKKNIKKYQLFAPTNQA